MLSLFIEAFCLKSSCTPLAGALRMHKNSSMLFN